MFFRWLFLSVLIVAIPVFGHAEPQRHWTHFFYISGDNDFEGPDYSSDKIRLLDQAWQLYERVIDLGRRDEQNNYVVFFDPAGSGSLFSGLFTDRRARIKIFRRGELISAGSDSLQEIDSTDPRTFERVADRAQSHLGSDLTSGKKSFYYYGEQFLNNPRFGLDRSHPASSFSTEDFLEGMAPFIAVGRFDLIVFQTCYLNTLEFVSGLSRLTRELLVGKDTIPNSAMSIFESYLNFDGSAEELRARLTQKNESSKHPFRFARYSLGDVPELSRLVRQVESGIAAEVFQPVVSQLFANATQGTWEGMQEEGKIFAEQRELVISLNDYLFLLSRMASSEERLLPLAAYLEAHPALQDLRVRLALPLPEQYQAPRGNGRAGS